MHFFRTREVAAEWTKERPAVVVLPLTEAWELARVHWVERRRRAFRPTS